MIKSKNHGVTLPGSGDPTSKKIDERMKTLFESYVSSNRLEEDFKYLKSSDRLQFIQKMSPYFIPKKDIENEKKKIIIGRPISKEVYELIEKECPSDETVVDINPMEDEKTREFIKKYNIKFVKSPKW